MLTIISSLVGMVLGFVPSIIKVYEKKQDNAFDLEMTKMKLEAATRNIVLEKQIEEIQAASNTQQAALQHDENIETTTSMGAFRASVRPIITYIFFLAFIVSKGVIMYYMIQAGKDPALIINTIWDDTTLNFFATIISFWFGNRAMEKLVEDTKIVPKPIPPKK